jgi:crotonobetainyl-CoA:carnitine CoA-transferase CaiB-like acyl-CoA transferase
VGILAALASRERTGQGERIDISMQDCCFSLVMDESLDMLVSREVPTRQGNRNPRVTPWSVFPTRDGNIAICVFANEHWKIFLEAIQREDCLEDPRFENPEDRVDHMEEVEGLVTEWSRTRSMEEALQTLRKRKIPCEPVLEVKDVLEDPQLKARGMIQELEHPLNPRTGAKTAGFPIRFSVRPAEDISPAPLLGNNNEEIYRGLLGFSREELEELRTQKVI